MHQQLCVRCSLSIFGKVVNFWSQLFIVLFLYFKACLGGLGELVGQKERQMAEEMHK